MEEDEVVNTEVRNKERKLKVINSTNSGLRAAEQVAKEVVDEVTIYEYRRHEHARRKNSSAPAATVAHEMYEASKAKAAKGAASRVEASGEEEGKKVVSQVVASKTPDGESRHHKREQTEGENSLNNRKKEPELIKVYWRRI